MAKKKRELTTRRMPSGAQQYVRPAETGRNAPAADRMRTIRNVARRSAAPGLSRQMTDALLDESVLARIADTNERQTREEDFNNAMRDIRAKRRKEGGAMKSKKEKAPAASKRPTPRPSRAPAASTRPAPRPLTAEERGALERGDRAARREAGMKAGGKVKKMAYGGKVAKKAMGGKCRGMGAATKGGKYSRS